MFGSLSIIAVQSVVESAVLVLVVALAESVVVLVEAAVLEVEASDDEAP